MEQAAADRWENAARRSYYRWRWEDACPNCGQWIGHFGGSTTKDPCPRIPSDVPLEEVRENCYDVRRGRIGDAIRAACERTT